MRKIIGSMFALALLAAGAAAAAELIQANAVNFGPGRSTGFLTIGLDRYSTDEERAAWRQAFAEGGQEALVVQWQEQNPKLGYLKFTQTLGYQIRAAISVPTEKGRKILIALDRPLKGFEIRANTRSEDYPIGWVELEVDAEGKGEGQMVGAAAFKVEDNRLVIETYGTQAVKLMNVTVKEKKEKDK
jgi:hypothetical protein